MKTHEKTLTCNLTTPELQKRRATVISELKERVLEKREIAEGLMFTFPASDEVLDKLLDFIKSERLCCDFFSFRLSIADETATLEITGPEGPGNFLKRKLGSKKNANHLHY